MSGARKAQSSGKRTQTKGSAKGKTSWLRRLVVIGLALVVVGVLAFGALYAVTDIPDENADFQTQTTNVFYAGGKEELGELALQDRESVPLAKMADTIKEAVVAAENRSFWTDSGIDVKGIIRAAFSNAQGNATQGASTITQQYVKILYLSQERTLVRKVKEAMISLKIQREKSKEEILEGYLNTIYFGRGAYGIEAAADAFFNTTAKNLNLRQAAVLASVLNNPSRYDPDNGKANRAALKERYDYTLRSMAETGAIDEQRATKAMKRLPKFPKIDKPGRYEGQRGHALSLVRTELTRLGFSESEIDGGGLQVTTTLTKKAMDAAEQGAVQQRPEGFGNKQLHTSVASVEPGTGALRGFYGGQDYLKSQLNWAAQRQQPGSAFKPFAVAEGINQGFELKDTFDGNSPFELDGGTPVENQGNKSYGRVSLVKATQDSINTAFMDLVQAMDNGAERTVEMSEKLGIPPDEVKPGDDPYGFPTTSAGLRNDDCGGACPGVVLGSASVSPINMANAYASIAAEGKYNEVHVVQKVVDKNGRTRYEHEKDSKQVLDKDIAADTLYAMQQVVQGGSGRSALALGRPVAGKTGTATCTDPKGGDDYVCSSWFVGATPQLATAVSYTRGKGNGRLDGWLPSFYGSDYPASTWTSVMGTALDGEPVESFPPPAYVTGTPPEDGHEYTPPPPPPEPKPTKTKEPEPTPTKTAPPDRDGDGTPDKDDPCPDDASDKCDLGGDDGGADGGDGGGNNDGGDGSGNGGGGNNDGGGSGNGGGGNNDGDGSGNGGGGNNKPNNGFLGLGGNDRSREE